MVAVASERARSHGVPRRAVNGGPLVNGERMAAALADGVDPRAVAYGVDAVGQSPAGQRNVRAFGRRRR